jgi:hypothetical protein
MRVVATSQPVREPTNQLERQQFPAGLRGQVVRMESRAKDVMRALACTGYV